MHPILLELGPLTIYTFGIFVVLAFLTAASLLYLFAKQAKLPLGRLADYALYSALAGLVGARVGYLLLHPDEASSLLSWLAIGGGRLSLATGLIAGAATLVFLLRRHGAPIWRWLDIAAIATIAGLAVGKLGSFLNGDYLGTPTGLPWGVTYDAPLSAANQALHPTAIYAAILLAVTSYYGYRLWKIAGKVKPGLVFWTVAFLAAASQVVLETWHEPAEALRVSGTRLNLVFGFLLLGARAAVLFKKYRIGARR